MHQQLLKNKKFILMLLSTLFSGIGIGMTLIAIPWTIINHFNSSTFIATMTVASNVAILLLLPKLSIQIDIHSKKWIMALLYLLGISIQVFVFLALSFDLSISMLALLFSSYLVSIFIRSADQVIRTAWSQELFDTSDYESVAQWLEVTRQAITLLAGGGATLLLQHTDLAWIIFADACSYLVGLCLILFIVSETRGKQRHNKPMNTTRYSAVFKFFASEKEYFLLTSVTLIPYIIVVAQNIIYPAHFKQFLQTTEAAFAFHAVPYAMGALLAPILTKKITWKLNALITPIFIGYILALITVTLFRNVAVTYVCLFSFAFLHVSIRIKRDTFMLHKTPNNIMGKTKGLFETIASIARAVLGLSIGLIADQLGIAYAWLFFAVLMAIIWLFFISNRSKQRLGVAQET